ncbi:hypothetical protein [Nonomuraea sp. NPDC049725]|uniref:hypothetical protein n=1 Tax=Nonomuraea sp. NPDC049725 TaxID=3154508 RepID=UPI00344868EF
MVLALRRLMLAIAIVSGLGIAGMSLAAPHALAASTAYVAADDDGADDDGADDDDDDGSRPRGGVDTGQGGTVRDDDDDDDRPRGGVETGQGGTAAVEGDATWSIDQQPVSAQSADGSDVTTVLLALGGISLLLGGAYLASRKLGGS